MEAEPQPLQDGAASGRVAMANIVTLTRLLLIFPLVALIYWVSPGWLWLAPAHFIEMSGCRARRLSRPSETTAV
jgi:phosphatidylglycerophosphate synthase